MKKTKIICTIGPASCDPTMIKNMILSGMNVARLNLSHGTHESHTDYINAIKVQREKLGVPVAIMLDLKGPEIRIKTFENGSIELQDGQIFTLTTGDVIGNQNIVSVTYKDLPNVLKAGDRILLNDGFSELEVLSVNNYDVITKVIEGGKLSNNKSINLPNVNIDMPYLSKVDKDDIKFGVEQDVDYIALSFVRTADDVREAKKYIRSLGGNSDQIKIISKIENQQGVDNINSIIAESDGIMVARGDLGVEVDFKLIPIYQKAIVDRSLKAGKIVIIATQMLESMVENLRPTRAELTDMANAVLDGASALMLSGETANGKHVIKCIETMSEVIETCEKNFIVKTQSAEIESFPDVSKSIAYACKLLSYKVNTKAIIVVSLTGKSVLEIASFRPGCPIIACTTSEKAYQQLALCWGAVPVKMEEYKSTDALLSSAQECALNTGIVKKGDMVIQTAGVPLGTAPTNLLKIETL